MADDNEEMDHLLGIVRAFSEYEVMILIKDIKSCHGRVEARLPFI